MFRSLLAPLKLGSDQSGVAGTSGSGNRVNASGMKRMAAQQPFERVK
jgi:hypothetical protein